MSACGISTELYSFSQHCCCSCCCCRYGLNVGKTQDATNRKLIVNSPSAVTISTGSGKCAEDRLKRLKANGRERDRMLILNAALSRLRGVLPTGNGPTRRRSSKIATLRAAHNYIRVLSSVLAEVDSTKCRSGETDFRVSSTMSSSFGDAMQQRKSCCFGDASPKPEVASSDVISGRFASLDRLSPSLVNVWARTSPVCLSLLFFFDLACMRVN